MSYKERSEPNLACDEGSPSQIHVGIITEPVVASYAVNPFGSELKQVSMQFGVSIIL